MAEHSAPFESDRPIGIDMKTAAISEVTSEMMAEAAHKAADAVVVSAHQAAHAMQDAGDGPAPHPASNTPVAPIRSERHVSADGSGPPSTLGVASPPTVIETFETSPRNGIDTSDTTALRSTNAIERQAASVEEVKSVAAMDVVAAESRLIFQGETMPSTGLLTPSTEAPKRAGETPRPRPPTQGGSLSLINAHVMDMLVSNIAATEQFLTAVMCATSFTDVVAVNTHHLRRRVELMTTQGRELTTLAQTFTLEAIKPFGPASTNSVQDR